MKHLNSLLAGLAVVALASCTNEEPAPDNGAKPEGDVAYMNIMIKSSESRSTTDQGYMPSWEKEDEHKVNTLRFYFFDESGVKAEIVAEDPNPSFGQNNAAGDTPNVEYTGTNNVIILKGLKGNTYPSYVLTVINYPDWVCPNTLAEASADLVTIAQNKPFVMTTSSYFNTGDKNHVDAYYYATKLDVSDFYTSEEAAKEATNVVNIYVERLEAKVQLGVAPSNDKKENVTRVDKDGNVIEEGITIYKLDQTVGGGGNNGGNNVLSTDLYVQVLGWNLNATANESHLGKQLKAEWNTTPVYAGWNSASDHRSFWAKSAIYGTKISEDGATNAKLNYLTPLHIAEKKAEFKNENDYIAYCYENTNAPENVVNTTVTENGSTYANVTNNTTHIVVATRVGVLNEAGQFVTENFITYRGALYREDSYLNLILARVANAGNLNYYVKTSTTTEDEVTTTEYTQVAQAQMTVYKDETASTGVVLVKLSDNVKEEDLYVKNSDGTWSQAPEGSLKTLKQAIADAQESNGTYPAVRHTEGYSFYTIPVEHHAVTAEKDVEGYYGVVRNHWYQVTINKFTRVGHGIFDPNSDKEIVKGDKEEDPLYYVGASINILSWKLIHQNAEL